MALQLAAVVAAAAVCVCVYVCTVMLCRQIQGSDRNYMEYMYCFAE